MTYKYDPAVKHVRKRLRALGGNPYRRDRTARVPRTVCGADVTDLDVHAKDADKACCLCLDCLTLVKAGRGR